MKLIFTGSKRQPFFDLMLTYYKKVSDVNVYSIAIAREIMKSPNCSIDANGLRTRLQFYMGGNGTIKEYIDHIEKYGFYTPYQPNMRIVIEHTCEDGEE